jgi:integrase
VKAKTIKSYEECVNRVRRDLGPIRLQALKPVDIERCYARMLTEGGREGKGLHARTVLHTHRVLHKALADAERLGLVIRNPVSRVTAPSAPMSASVDSVWTADDLRTFLEASADEPLYPAFVLAATTGMRRGEVAALSWSAVDLESGVLRVEESVIPVRGVLMFTPPKTKKGVRVLTLDAGTLAVLKAHRERQAKRQLALGPAWEDTGRVFTQEFKQPPATDEIPAY